MLRLFMVILSIALLTTSCGFQLRGTQNSGFIQEPIALLGDAKTPFATVLRELMDEQNIVVSGNADVSIKIIGASQNKRTLSISAQAQSAEYELVKQVQFAVLNDTAGLTLLGNTPIEARRNYISDTRYPAAMADQERSAWYELNKELARRVLARTQQVLNP